nr:putative reverse transcriptase domain-containing protein [Tanacetum cinerariifolium]
MLRACAMDFGENWDTHLPLVGESKIDGQEIIQETTDKIVQVKERLKTARDRQKSYADHRRKLLEFSVGDKVLLKVSPRKGVVRFGLRKKYRFNPNNDTPPRDKMDDPDIALEEYIRPEEEKARNHRKVFNWETAKYGNIWYDEDVHDLRSVETKFPAIVFNDNLTSVETRRGG